MMWKSTVILLTVMVLPLLAAGGGPPENPGRGNEQGDNGTEDSIEGALQDRLIVVFHRPTLPTNAEDLVRRSGGKVLSAIPQVGVLLAEPVSADSDKLAKRLSKSPAVLGVAPDIHVQLIAPAAVESGSDDVSPEDDLPHPFPLPAALPFDGLYKLTPQQWSVQRIGANGAAIGTLPGAWDVTTGGGATIAVLDTGVSTVHPDIAPNLVGALSLVSLPSPCDDGGPEDQFGHGTWVASLAAGAAGPGTGLVIGTAPSAGILSIKVLQRVPGEGATPLAKCVNGGATGSFFDVGFGMILATQLGADVINMSLGAVLDKSTPLGGLLYSFALRVANFAYNNNVVIVAAAGNESARLDATDPIVAIPAELPNVIAAVATTNPSPPIGTGVDLLASYSNFGASLHGLGAPGGDLPPGPFLGPTGFVRGACSPGIPGTSPGLPATGGSLGCFGVPLPVNHFWYIQAAGTSASVPHVAGVAALIKSIKPDLRANQVRAILQQSAEDVGPVGYDPSFNYGLVDANAGVQAALTPP